MSRFTCYAFAALVSLPVFGQGTAINISGTVTDSAGVPIAAAEVKLTTSALTTTSGADGSFSLKSTGTGMLLHAIPQAQIVAIRNGQLFFNIVEKSEFTLTAYGLQGEELASIEQILDPGAQSLQLPQIGSGVGFFKIKSGQNEAIISALSIENGSRTASLARQQKSDAPALTKQAATAAALYDVITVTKAGFLKAYVNVTNSDSSNMKIKLLKEGSTKFSFFVTSLKALQDLSKSTNGFGGDFRFGETGAGAGLRGADKLCATIAERSLPGASVKGWRAFLSVTADANGKQVDAITRIGEGPWHDRTGRVLAPKKADLLATRPQNGDPTIQNDLPNEDGIPNHRPDPNKPADDNHHTVTGSNATGTLLSATATCKDWTVSEVSTAHGKPSAGFSWPRGTGGGSSGSNWMTTWNAPGCGAGIEITNTSPAGDGTPIIGGGGGYGGFYCFALNP